MPKSKLKSKQNLDVKSQGTKPLTPSVASKNQIVTVTSFEEEEKIFYQNRIEKTDTKIVFCKGSTGHRPRAPIAKTEFKNLARLLPTSRELQNYFGVCEESLAVWAKSAFSEIEHANIAELIETLGVGYNLNLRRNMMKLAEKSTSMAIYLSKQYLGMKEQPHLSAEHLQIEQVNYHLPGRNIRDFPMWQKCSKEAEELSNSVCSGNITMTGALEGIGAGIDAGLKSGIDAVSDLGGLNKEQLADVKHQNLQAASQPNTQPSPQPQQHSLQQQQAKYIPRNDPHPLST